MGFEKQNEAESSNSSLPREDTPLLSGNHKPYILSSQPKTFANVFIAIVGAGVLGLPYTFMRTGCLTSLIMVFFVALLTYHGMTLLIHTRKRLEDSPVGAFPKIASFGDLGFAGRFAVDSMVVLSQAGFCVGYLIFIGAMGVVMVQDAIIFTRQMPVVEAFGTLSTFFYGLGVAVYSFEGVGMALPLELEMEDKSKFGKILGLTMVFIAAIYGGFGVMGYFAFGENTKDIITGNMGKGLLSTIVQLGLCINLFFTFPLMMNPVYEEILGWEVLLVDEMDACTGCEFGCIACTKFH